MSIPRKHTLKKKKTSSIMGVAMTAEGPYMDGAGPMQQPNWYAMFCTAVEGDVRNRRRDFPNGDWLIACFDSRKKFVERFPTEKLQQEFVERLLALRKRVSAAVRRVLRRKAETGLTYADIERLQYEFPGPGSAD